MKPSDTKQIALNIFNKIKPKIDKMPQKELIDYFCANFDAYNNLQLLLNDLYDREKDGINPIFLYKVEADFEITKKVIFYINEKLDKEQIKNES